MFAENRPGRANFWPGPFLGTEFHDPARPVRAAQPVQTSDTQWSVVATIKHNAQGNDQGVSFVHQNKTTQYIQTSPYNTDLLHDVTTANQRCVLQV